MNPLEQQFHNGLPAAVDTERLVLGSMLLYPLEQAPIAIDLLTDADFSISDHQKAFRRLSTMATEGQKIDMVTLGNALMHQDGFPQDMLVEFIRGTTRGLPKIINLDAYCEILRDRSALRTAILTLNAGILALTARGANRHTISEIQGAVANLGADADDRASGFEMIGDIIENVNGGGMLKFLETPLEEMGIPWPLSSLTNATGGFRPGNTTVIGAETGGGKTTMATMCALHAADLGYGVAILSAEMTKWEVSKKIIAQHGHLCLADWLQQRQDRNGRRATESAAKSLIRAVIAIDERPDVTPSMLEAGILRLRRKLRIDLVIVDYIQLMESGQKEDGNSRERHIAYISRSMKKMCKRLNIAGIILTQLNDDGKVRESRQIKMDASNVVILSDKGGGNFEANLEKARFSAKRRIPLFFDGATGNFFETENM
jgi:replicative DNA helicase